MCFGLAGSAASASKSMTASKRPLVRIHSFTATRFISFSGL